MGVFERGYETQICPNLAPDLQVSACLQVCSLISFFLSVNSRRGIKFLPGLSTHSRRIYENLTVTYPIVDLGAYGTVVELESIVRRDWKQ